VSIREPSQVAEARRRAVEMGRAVSLDAQSLSRLEIVTTELATNLLRHGEGGEIVLTSPRAGSVEVIALDRGPGIPNLEQSKQDGFSTGSTAGLGLGAIRRQSRACSIFAPAAMGTVVSALVQSPELASVPETAAICIPLRGQSISGDTCARAQSGDRRAAAKL
jgi:anti-sigma regulatory factor (Ser/Thr protein kinase)